MIIVRYADDFIVGFQHEEDARRFLDTMRERLQEVALSLHLGEDPAHRVRTTCSGPNAQAANWQKPETFTFRRTIFASACQTRRGKFQIKRKSRRDRMRVKLQAIKKAGTAAAHASVDPRTGRMAEAGRQRLLR